MGNYARPWGSGLWVPLCCAVGWVKEEHRAPEETSAWQTAGQAWMCPTSDSKGSVCKRMLLGPVLMGKAGTAALIYTQHLPSVPHRQGWARLQQELIPCYNSSPLGFSDLSIPFPADYHAACVTSSWGCPEVKHLHQASLTSAATPGDCADAQWCSGCGVSPALQDGLPTLCLAVLSLLLKQDFCCPCLFTGLCRLSSGFYQPEH